MVATNVLRSLADLGNRIHVPKFLQKHRMIEVAIDAVVESSYQAGDSLEVVMKDRERRTKYSHLYYALRMPFEFEYVKEIQKGLQKNESPRPKGTGYR